MPSVVTKGPLKKGTVRDALDKRIYAARKEVAKLDAGTRYLDTNRKIAIAEGKERVLQNVRNELFGEKLPKAAKPK